jgi:hypothetical protein
LTNIREIENGMERKIDREKNDKKGQRKCDILKVIKMFCVFKLTYPTTFLCEDQQFLEKKS